MQQLLVYGAGGFAREVSILIEAINHYAPTWDLLGYVSDDPEEHGKRIWRGKVLGFPADVLKSKPGDAMAIVIAIGSPEVLASKPILLRKINPDLRFPTMVYPTVVLNRNMVQFGEGNIIAAGCLFTTDIELGSFNIINLGCIVAHDVVIGNHCVLNPGAVVNSGVRVESRSVIGSGAVILPRVTIGEGSVVAIGAVVGASVEPYTVVAGNPARTVRHLAPGDRDIEPN